MRRLTYLLITLIVLSCVFAPAANAQTPSSGQCNGEGALQGDFALSPAAGPAGTHFVLNGSFILVPGVTETSLVVAGPNIEIWWFESGTDARMLGTVPSFYDIDTQVDTFTAAYNVPGDSAPGVHQVGFLVAESGMNPACLAFNVTQTVQEDAYTSGITSLPSTGTILAPLLVGVALAGAGSWLLRRRSNKPLVR